MNRPAEQYLPQVLERGWLERLATVADGVFPCDYCGEPIEVHSMLVEDPGGFCFHEVVRASDQRKSCAEKAAEAAAEQQAYNQAQP